MNYAGKFDAALFPDGHVAHDRVYKHLDGPPAHAPADAILVPDAHFLFNADFKRSGSDLVLSSDGRDLVLHDYFKGDKRPALASPDGAHLTGDLVKALTGTVEVSQADGAANAGGKVIGHVTKLQGTATAIRNGVSIILHQGDNVEKGDVVQSGSESTLGITFIDGTVFGLSSNARMVLNEMVYDPNGSNNSSLISLVAGTISFVAGATAKHGDMKVDTPVATMGIRGTAVLVEIDFNVPGQGGLPDAKFQVLVEPDGTTGSYVLFDKSTLQPIAVVNQAGQQINISNGTVSQTNTTLPPDVQKLINDVFTLKFTDNSNTNPKTTTHFTDIGVLEMLVPLKFDNGIVATLTYVVTPPSGSAGGTVSGPGVSIQHIPGPPSAVVLDAAGVPKVAFALTERAGQTGHASDLDVVNGQVNYLDINAGDQPSVSVSFKSFSYLSAANGNVSLNALQLQDVAATEVSISVVQDPNHKNYGTATWSYSVPDSAFDFLAAGEKLTLTYIIRVDNNYAPSNEYTEIPVTITVTGTNDVPVITTSAQTIAFEGGTSIPGGPLTSDDPTSGTLTFKDVDLTDTHTVSVALTSPQGNIPNALWQLFGQAMTASLASDSAGTGTGSVTWSLADLPVYVADFIPDGQSVTLTYTITISDGHGGTTQQTVTVTITGTDDPAVVWIATQSGGEGETGTLFWRDGANWAAGEAPTANDDVIIITDQLRGLTPAYPVTIDQAAFAKSVTMNDYGGGEQPPELDNLSTLTITGAFTVRADAIVHNEGTIYVGGQVSFLDHSVLDNSGTLELKGGTFGSDASITNSGLIELVAGTLTVAGDVANDGGEMGLGEIRIDLGGTLELDGGSITGGTVTIEGPEIIGTFASETSPPPSPGVLKLAGSADVTDAIIANDGRIVVSGTGNALHGVTVTSNRALDILEDGALTIDDGSALNNSDGSVSVADGATLSLDDASISFGEITNAAGGTIALTGHAALISGTLGNGGAMTVSGSANVFDGETVTNSAGASLTIALNGVLELTGTSIAGGAIHNNGKIDVTGDSTIDGSAVDGGSIFIGTPFVPPVGNLQLVALDEGGNGDGGNDGWSPVTLTIEGGTTITGAQFEIGAFNTLAVAGEGATLTDVGIDNGGIIDVAHDSLLVLDSSTISGGALVNHGTVHVETEGATTFNGVNVDNSDGVILIDDEEMPVPAALVLDGDTAITGGALDIGIVGTVEVQGWAVTLSGVLVDNSGIFEVGPDAHLELNGVTVTNTGTFEVDQGAIVELAGTTIEGGKLSLYGTIEASGENVLGGDITNDGVIKIVAGTFEINGHVTGTGEIEVASGATLKVEGHVEQTIDFLGEGGGTLVLEGKTVVATVSSLDIGDKIDLAGITFGDKTTATYDAKTNELTITDAQGDTVTLAFPDNRDYTHAHFAASDDGNGGTLITLKETDDAPVIASDDVTQAATFGEHADATGSSQPNPSPAATGAIHFSDVDLTDRPTASIGTQSVTWTAADHSSLSLSQSQIDLLEHALTLSQPGNTNNGVVTWSYAIADGALDFLGDGETITVTSTVVIDDHEGEATSVPVVITITGSNDKPVITSAAPSVVIPEHANWTGVPLLDTASGTITFTDADLTDHHTVTIADVSANGDTSGLPDEAALLKWLKLGAFTDTQSGAGGSQAWSFSAKDSAFDYLAPGKSVTLTYTVAVADGHGGIATVPVEITVTGSEDAPVIVGETNPAVQTVVLTHTPTVLTHGSMTNAEHLPTETFDEINAGSVANNGRGHGDFYSSALHAWFHADGNAGVVHGSSSVSAAPYQDSSNYLSVGAGAHETITFDHPQNSFGLYWGSVDSYNSISFYNDGKLIASYDGSDIAPLVANGGQGSSASNGYVEFLDLAPFDKVVIGSSSNAFELDNVSAGTLHDSHVDLAPIKGTLTVVDKDIGDTLTASVTGDAVITYNGSLRMPSGVDVSALIDKDAIHFDTVTSDGKPDELTWTYDPSGAHLDFLSPGDTLTITYFARVSDGHGSFGLQPLTVTLTGNDNSVINGTAHDDTFQDVGGGATIFGKGGSDTFVFKPNFGSATIGDFNVNKDVIELDHNMFAQGTTISEILNSPYAHEAGGDTIITDAAHDTLTLKHVSLAQLQAHQDGFHIV